MSGDRAWWYEVMNCETSKSKACYNQWQTIHIAALVPGCLSIIACIYIIVTGIVYHQRIKTLRLSFGTKIPLFISLVDLIYEVNHGSDHLHNLITGYVSEGGLCQLFGSMKPWCINAQTAWALATAFYLMSVLKHGKDAQFEKQGLILQILCWGIPTIILIIGFGLNAYGVEGPWCGVPYPLMLCYIFYFSCCIIIIIIIIYKQPSLQHFVPCVC